MPRFKFKYRTWVTIVAIIGLIGGAGFGALRTWEVELFPGDEPAAQTQAAGARAAAGGGQFAAAAQGETAGCRRANSAARRRRPSRAGRGCGDYRRRGGRGKTGWWCRRWQAGPVVAAPLARSSP